MFPNPDDFPARLPELPIHQGVSLSVGLEFVFPESPVGFGHRPVFGTEVPEATVNKHGHSFLDKNKVRLPRKFLLAPPAADFVLSEKSYQNKLGFLVAASSDLGHDVRAFSFCPNVSHWDRASRSEKVVQFNKEDVSAYVHKITRLP